MSFSIKYFLIGPGNHPFFQTGYLEKGGKNTDINILHGTCINFPTTARKINPSSVDVYDEFGEDV